MPRPIPVAQARGEFVKQILQSPRSGNLELVDVPAPALGPGMILVKNAYSVMSPGTEKMAMDFARQSMLGKARSRPDLVQQVVRKLIQEGPLPTYRTVTNRLDAPQPLGYSSAGIVEAVGEGVDSFKPGDRVACAGAGYANHAELIVVPENLTAHVPEGVSLDRAAFATLGAIAMQGLRIGDPTLGEVAVVIGLGLIGQLTVQLLLANGCRVYGLDLAPKRVEEALGFGMDWGGSPSDAQTPWLDFATGGHGADLAIVTAASDSSAPIALAAELCRKKGRVVTVGATAMDLDRRSFFDKELELRMSMSYGPGRYDARYEEEGVDYPISYVRWTEQRNLQSFIDLVERGSINPLDLAHETVAFSEAVGQYEELAAGGRSALSTVFEYGEDVDRSQTHAVTSAGKRAPLSGEIGVSFIGAGNYAKGVLLPALGGAKGVQLQNVVTSTGPSAQRTAERFGFAQCGTSTDDLLGENTSQLVFVTTRHDTHAALAIQALEAGRAVWLEKPVALDRVGVDRVEQVTRESDGFLMVGYNRRFSAHARAARELVAGRRGASAIQYVVSAGAMPTGTWVVDEQIGGGRIIGEVCHFVDLCTYLVGALPVEVYARSASADRTCDDSLSFVIGYADGSTASVSYLANATSTLPKERWEVHADGESAICDNFRKTSLSKGKGLKTLNQDKGQAAAIEKTIECLKHGSGSPIPIAEVLSTSRVTFAIVESLRSGRAVALEPA